MTSRLRGRDALADVVGLDRELAVAAVDEDREADRARPAEVDDAVERGADGAAGVEDVVAEDDRPSVQVEVDLRLLDQGLRRDRREVVAVERDVERADREALSGTSPPDAPPGAAASGTPRVRMPTRASPGRSFWRSAISCAIRSIMRRMRSASRILAFLVSSSVKAARVYGLGSAPVKNCAKSGSFGAKRR